MKTAILLHVHHLDTIGWGRIVWGDPKTNKLGDLTALVRVLLEQSNDQAVSRIMFGCGPSAKGGLTEGQYTKQYLLDRFDELVSFPTLRLLLKDVTTKEQQQLRRQLEAMTVFDSTKNTKAEIIRAAQECEEHDITKVIQITSPSHAPRCLQLQAWARAKGYIPAEQSWSVVASDICLADAEPLDTVIFEPPNLQDDPMLKIYKRAYRTMSKYFALPNESKKRFLRHVEQFFDRLG